MMKNVDFLKYTPRQESTIYFYVAGKAKKISEISEEILDVTKKVIDINNGFFIPTRVECIFLDFPEDYSASDVFDHMRMKVSQIEIKSDKGVTFNEIKEHVHNIVYPKDVIRYLRRIKLYGKSKFILKNKDEYIDENSKELFKFLNRDDTVSRLSPGVDPINIYIEQSFVKGESKPVESSEPAYYDISFWSETDVWFENTEIGLANRNRLRQVVKKLYDNFDVVDSFFLSEWYSVDDLKQIVFGID